MSETKNPPPECAPYEVGYAKPPKASQWKKGQSGNPAGKKKGTKNFGAQFQKVASKLVTVKDGGKLMKVKLIEAALNGAFDHAAKGDIKNVAQALKLVEEFAPNGIPALPKDGEISQSPDGGFYINKWLSHEEEAALEKCAKYFRQVLSNPAPKPLGR